MKSHKEVAQEEGRSYNEIESSPSRPKKESRRILRRSKTLKEKNDPDRFSGGGIQFRAKIIGTERVLDARGNRMCQGALQRLKAAVKTSGDHKQKILLNISLNGILIKDEKSKEILHHHPIHKISFISQDTSDNRAFGYVFGCPQTGHEFFGIKTEKIASQVVLTLRDLFMSALELKKREIETALGEGQPTAQSQDETSNKGGVASGAAAVVVQNGKKAERKLCSELLYSNSVSLPDETSPVEEEPVVVDTLLDLQFSMDSLQQGISHMDQSIARGFGFSFSEDDISESSGNSIPVSFHLKMDKLSSLYQETLSLSSRSSSTSDYVCATDNKVADEAEIPRGDLSISMSSATSDQSMDAVPAEVGHPTSDPHDPSEDASSQNDLSPNPVEDKYAVFLDIDALPSIFDNPNLVIIPQNEDLNNSLDNDCREICDMASEVMTSTPIVFAELDPLGNHPDIDKKDFFQDLKKPPKKVLKDLVGSIELFSTNMNSGSVDCSDTEDFPGNGTADFQTFPLNSKVSLSGHAQLNPFVNPPVLPPKKCASVVATFSDISKDPITIKEDLQWDVKNPFNPFSAGDYPDVPPPSSPPPPPPPRLPFKVGDTPLSPPPPPRPPSRSNGIPTPPLPRRRSPLATSSQTWFSFDQDALSCPYTEPEMNPDCSAPPLPSPARKFPPPASPSKSASSSPVNLQRVTDRSPLGEVNRRMLSRHSSISQDAEAFMIVSEIAHMKVQSISDGKKSNSTSNVGVNHRVSSRHSSKPEESVSSVADKTISEGKRNVQLFNASPPLPPKPMVISRPRPSPGKRARATSSSFSASTVESSNGTNSSSSLVFSSLEDSKVGSSAEEPLFLSSGEHLNSEQTPKRKPEEELSPDSIFRRKSDPFADEFFLTLPKRSTDTESNCTNGIEMCFEDFK